MTPQRIGDVFEQVTTQLPGADRVVERPAHFK
jgi:hypothetical protein